MRYSDVDIIWIQISNLDRVCAVFTENVAIRTLEYCDRCGHLLLADVAEETASECQRLEGGEVIFQELLVEARQTQAPPLHVLPLSPLPVLQYPLVLRLPLSVRLKFRELFVLCLPLLLLHDKEGIFCSVEVEPQSSHHVINLHSK